MKQLKLFKPYVSWRSIWNVLRVLFSGQLAEGPEVKRFEREFAHPYWPNVLAVNSGTSALELAYHLAGIGKGDKVLVPVLGCAATVSPLVRRGANVVFVDIGDDLNVDVDDLRRKANGAKAIVFVAFGGNTEGLFEAREIAYEVGAKLVYDAAQSIGKGMFYMADYSCVSLQATKTVNSGDGGFLLCRDYADHERAKKLRWFGLVRGDISNQTIAEAGYKFHMNDIAAAIGRGNLRALPKLIKHRAELAKIYKDAGLFAHPWLAGYIGERVRGCDFEQGQHHYRLDNVFGIKSKCPNMDRLEGRYWFVPYGHHVSVRQAKKIANALK